MKGFLKDNSFPCRVFRNRGIMTQKAANKLSFLNVIRGTEEELRACRIFILVVRQFTKKVLMMGTGKVAGQRDPALKGSLLQCDGKSSHPESSSHLLHIRLSASGSSVLHWQGS